MTFRVAVCYGAPHDTETFDEHYTTVHIPLAHKVPGLRDFTWGKVQSVDGSTPPYYAVANLYFADAAALEAAMKSPEMRGRQGLAQLRHGRRDHVHPRRTVGA